MDFTLQVHGAKYIFPIPDGLKELSSDIIREVLRHQPQNINGFIADYLETMLVVRKNAREAGSVICDVFREGYFFDELFRTKNIDRTQANSYATVIQASWRGYVVRKKIGEWLKKKKRFEEEKDRKRSIRIEELLAGLGISLSEATRAAGLIQTAYKESKRGKYISSDLGEFWVGESVPFGQRIREGDRAQGRFDRWEKEDFGDFFEMDAAGAIKYTWPRVGQLRRVPIEDVPPQALIVQFFGMRDLNGVEQYSYLIKTQSVYEVRGVPVGFLIPLPKASDLGSAPEVEFVNSENATKMGHYTYIFRDNVEREDLEKFDELLKAQAQANVKSEVVGEFDYDPYWVLPRVIVRIKKDHLLDTDDEVNFTSLPEGIVCEQDAYTFRAETLEQTAKIIRYILRDKCLTVTDALVEAANMAPYKVAETGRIFPVDVFSRPDYIQKINIIPESLTGDDESLDLMEFEYIFLPPKFRPSKNLPKGEAIFSVLLEIPMVRFEGFHSDYRGSADLENQVFIMGPKLTTPNGKPLTYESLFWDEFGIEAWHQLLATYAAEYEKELQGEVRPEEEIFEEDVMYEEEEDYEEKVTLQPEMKSRGSKSDKQSLASAGTEPIFEPEADAGDKAAAPPSEPPTELPAEAEGEGKLEKVKKPEEEEENPEVEPDDE